MPSSRPRARKTLIKANLGCQGWREVVAARFFASD